MPDLSIIIVTYNNADTIGRCLHSLLDTTDAAGTEIIIIDNDSPDNTVDVINEVITRNTSEHAIRLIENSDNLYFAAGCNQGLDAATGEYLVLLNPDTVSLPGTWSTLVGWYEAHPKAGVIGPRMLNETGGTVPSCREFPTVRTLLFETLLLPCVFSGHRQFDHWRMGYFDHAQTRRVDQPMGACMLTRRDKYTDVGMLDERFPMFFNDVDWCRRFQDSGYDNYFVSESQLVHVGGHSVRRRPLTMLWFSHRGFLAYLKKYTRGGWGNPVLWIAAVLLGLGWVARVAGVLLRRIGRKMRANT
jgi:GT2 family glycosyltransferase